MLKGKLINLRTIQEDDLTELLALLNDLSKRGQYYPIKLESEPLFKERFHQTGLWEEKNGWMLITDKEDHKLGIVVYFEAIGYPSALEVGSVIFDPKNWQQGYTTEAGNIFAAYLF